MAELQAIEKHLRWRVKRRSGPAGLGKTHLSVAIGLKMVQRGYVVRFITVQALLIQALARRDLEARLKVLKPP